jgi:streptogramin lyase
MAAVAAVVATSGGGAKGLSVIPPQSVGLLDPESGEIVAAIAVGPRPTRAAFGRGAVWIASADDGTLLRIDPRTHNVVKTIGLGFKPADLTVAPDGVYLADPGRVSVVRVDPDSNTVSEATPVTRLHTGTAGPAGAPSRIAFGAGSIWGDTGFGETRVFRLRVGPNTLSSFELGSYTPDGLAYTGGSLWTASFSDGVISRIDPARNAVTATIRLGTGTDAPFATALAAGTNGVWATGVPPEHGAGSYAADYSKAGRVFHIDSGLNGVVASVKVGRQSAGGGPSVLGYGTATTHGIAVGDGAVWVANGGDGTLMRIDPTRNVVVQTIEIGKGVDGVAAGAGYVWVSRP